MYYVEVEKGVKIAVYDLNPDAKKTIFFIHGWPVDHRMFEYQLDVMPKLGFRCVSIDLRGFGQSSAPWDGYTYDRMADDVHAVIRGLNVPGLTLAGFSMGGPIAIRYMSRHMGFKVNKLALLAAAAPSFTKRPGYPYGSTPEQIDAFITQAYNDRPQLVTDFGKMFFASNITLAFADWFNSLGFDASGHGTIRALEMLKDGNLSADLQKIQVPTGIFHGKLDKVCPYAFAEEMHSGIRTSKIYPFENSGHAVFYDELAKFIREFYAFVNS